MGDVLFAILQLIGGVILSVGWVPQIVLMCRERSAKGLHLNTVISMFTGVLLMEIYALDLITSGTGYAFLITNTMSLLLLSIVLFLALWYRRK
ncbi:PQ-loop domain-containing transporter [Paenibacillus sp. FSL K6-1230]|uniref:PQ-loop domain-containing transporter n=1 Tax=Paenibacillus sp. FSL K6-1230 TaxID=2921603 RepID=UPI0030FA7E25